MKMHLSVGTCEHEHEGNYLFHVTRIGKQSMRYDRSS